MYELVDILRAKEKGMMNNGLDREAPAKECIELTLDFGEVSQGWIKGGWKRRNKERKGRAGARSHPTSNHPTTHHPIGSVGHCYHSLGE